jgi:hypothetical protein
VRVFAESNMCFFILCSNPGKNATIRSLFGTAWAVVVCGSLITAIPVRTDSVPEFSKLVEDPSFGVALADDNGTALYFDVISTPDSRQGSPPVNAVILAALEEEAASIATSSTYIEAMASYAGGGAGGNDNDNDSGTTAIIVGTVVSVVVLAVVVTVVVVMLACCRGEKKNGKSTLRSTSVHPAPLASFSGKSLRALPEKQHESNADGSNNGTTTTTRSATAAADDTTTTTTTGGASAVMAEEAPTTAVKKIKLRVRRIKVEDTAATRAQRHQQMTVVSETRFGHAESIHM